MAQSISTSAAEDSAIIVASISSQSSASEGALDIKSQSETSTYTYVTIADSTSNHHLRGRHGIFNRIQALSNLRGSENSDKRYSTTGVYEERPWRHEEKTLFTTLMEIVVPCTIHATLKRLTSAEKAPNPNTLNTTFTVCTIRKSTMQFLLDSPHPPLRIIIATALTMLAEWGGTHDAPKPRNRYLEIGNFFMLWGEAFGGRKRREKKGGTFVFDELASMLS